MQKPEPKKLTIKYDTITVNAAGKIDNEKLEWIKKRLTEYFSEGVKKAHAEILAAESAKQEPESGNYEREGGKPGTNFPLSPVNDNPAEQIGKGDEILNRFAMFNDSPKREGLVYVANNDLRKETDFASDVPGNTSVKPLSSAYLSYWDYPKKYQADYDTPSSEEVEISSESVSYVPAEDLETQLPRSNWPYWSFSGDKGYDVEASDPEAAEIPEIPLRQQMKLNSRPGETNPYSAGSDYFKSFNDSLKGQIPLIPEEAKFNVVTDAKTGVEILVDKDGNYLGAWLDVDANIYPQDLMEKEFRFADIIMKYAELRELAEKAIKNSIELSLQYGQVGLMERIFNELDKKLKEIAGPEAEIVRVEKDRNGLIFTMKTAQGQEMFFVPLDSKHVSGIVDLDDFANVIGINYSPAPFPGGNPVGTVTSAVETSENLTNWIESKFGDLGDNEKRYQLIEIEKTFEGRDIRIESSGDITSLTYTSKETGKKITLLNIKDTYKNLSNIGEFGGIPTIFVDYRKGKYLTKDYKRINLFIKSPATPDKVGPASTSHPWANCYILVPESFGKFDKLETETLSTSYGSNPESIKIQILNF